MTRHLHDAELVDLLDEVDAPQYRDHLDRCAICRGRIDALRATLQGLERSEPNGVPEPSPLFWDHFSRRVRDAIADTPAPRRHRWIGALAPLAAVCVLCVAGLFIWSQNRSHSPVATPRPETARAPAPAFERDALDLEDDVEWALVRVAADDIEWDAAVDAGVRADPGAAERVALEMSARERQELERLIQAEIKHTGA
jgi:hypothetical protein